MNPFEKFVDKVADEALDAVADKVRDKLDESPEGTVPTRTVPAPGITTAMVGTKQPTTELWSGPGAAPLDDQRVALATRQWIVKRRETEVERREQAVYAREDELESWERQLRLLGRSPDSTKWTAGEWALVLGMGLATTLTVAFVVKKVVA